MTAPATVGATEGTLLTFTVSAADPDGQIILGLVAAPLPTGATFTKNATNTSGTFSWTPAFGQNGTYNVTFTANNNLSGSATTTITVVEGDRAPVVTAPDGHGGGSSPCLHRTASDPTARRSPTSQLPARHHGRRRVTKNASNTRQLI